MRERLLNIVKERDWPMTELARRLGVAMNTVRNMMNEQSPHDWAFKTKDRVKDFLKRYEGK